MSSRAYKVVTDPADGRLVFSAFRFEAGRLAELDRQYPSVLHAWDVQKQVMLGKQSTYYGYVELGPSVLQVGGRAYTLYAGMWFVQAGALTIEGGRGLIIEREGHKALAMMGGPVEHAGRLKYIDGCTDSLLASPTRKGDPCLNLLYFPAGIDQTAHTHPSDRIGLILSGRGLCIVGEPGEAQATIDLEAGMLFCIHTDGRHKFATPYQQDMRVLAYHPDSDFGPSDEEHPMLNRTIVDGVSARNIDAIRTK